MSEVAVVFKNVFHSALLQDAEYVAKPLGIDL